MTFDPDERSELRRALTTIVDEAPTAPDFDRLTAHRTIPKTAARRPAFAFAAAAAVVLVGVGAFMVLARAPNRSPDGADVGAFGPDHLPRMLVDLPGWTVERFDESAGDLEGGGVYHRAETTYTSDAGSADLRIEAGDGTTLEGLVADRLDAGTEMASQTLLGVEATVVRYNDPTDDFTAMWTANGVVFELRAALDETTFRSVLGSLQIVDDETWDAAMPSTVVAGSERVEVVPQMLEGVPLPPGFDASELVLGSSKDRYQLGAEVVGSVTCAWIEEWIDAKAAGDQTRIDTAVDAMGTSQNWPILIEMSQQGAYHQVVAQYAEAMAGDGTIQGGITLSVESSYEQAFTCR